MIIMSSLLTYLWNGILKERMIAVKLQLYLKNIIKNKGLNKS